MKKTAFLVLLVMFLGGAATAFAQERIVLEENFSGNENAWAEANDENIFAQINAGMYQLERRIPDDGSSIFFGQGLPLNPESDFEISTTLTQTFGSRSSEFGFLWGARDAANYFAFTINSSGQYHIYKNQDGSIQELKPVHPSQNILGLQGKANTLTIRRVSELLSFYANGKFLCSIPAQDFLGQKAGYILHNKMEITVADLTARQNAPMREVFVDGFGSDTNNWILTQEDSAISVQKRGKLYMQPAEGKRATFLMREILLNTERDFEIEANIRQIIGENNKAYGLVWGAEDEKNSYMFLINSFGSYSVMQRTNGETKKLIELTSSEQMLHQRITPNKLVVRKSGKQVDFFLNDIWMAQIPFSPFMGEKMGFVLLGDLKIGIDFMTVREGEKSFQPPPVAVVKDPPITAQPPAITMLQPTEAQLTIDKKSIAFKAGISSKSTLKGIRLMVNEIQIPMQAKRDPSGEYDLIIEQDLPLKAEANKIQLMAKNEAGLIQRQTLNVEVKLENQPINRNGTDYALFFGANEYSEWSDLTNPVHDVRTIAQELESNYGFNTELVLDADKKDVLKKLKEYARKKFGPNDQLLIFFAGHGKFDEFFKEGYVVCSNSRKNDEGNDSYLSHSSLCTIVNNIPSKHTFLVMDVCFGGTIDPFIATSGSRGDAGTLGSGLESGQTEFIERKLKFKTRKYLTSGGKEYVPDGTPGAHSPFARKFLEALRNYGGQDRIITQGELALYFERLTPEPRAGEFGSNEPGSDFLFIAR